MDVVTDTGSGPVGRPLRRLGKYELISRIAAGGMAEVYLARLRGPMNFQKAVVIKVIHPHLASQEEFLRMLLDEARLSALIKHPRVVDIYELGCEEGIYFIAMEFISGQPLNAVMGSGIAGRPMDPFSTARIVADAADGLHAAHELKGASGNTLGLVHRDVSPGNIMVTHDGGVKIVDFGIAKARGRLTISGVQQFKGKVGYVAPEQLSGGIVDRRTDVFGLGVVMWEALALQRLFRTEDEEECLRTILGGEPPTPSAIRPEVPVELSAICLKALAPFPDYRFQTAGEMRDAIESFLMRVGYHREAGAIRSYMEAVFGRQHESRQKAVRRLAHVTMSGEMPIAVDVTFDDEDFPDLEVKYSPGPGDQAAADLARGTPTEQSDRHTASEDATVPLDALTGPRSRPHQARTDSRQKTTGVERRPIAPPARKRGRGLLIALLLVAIAGAIGGSAALVSNGSSGSPGSERITSVPHQPEAGSAAAAAAASDDPPAAPATDRPATEPAAAAAQPTAEATVPAGKKSARTRAATSAAAASTDKDSEKKSAAELYEEGADLFVQGKTSTAKDRFKQAIAADARFAPAYRGLGLVYAAEKRRDKAKKSFERYLQLRPGAGDAAAIRARIEQLEK